MDIWTTWSIPLRYLQPNKYMRTFSDFEKTLLRKIKFNKERGLHIGFTALMDDYLQDKGLRIDPPNNQSYILFNARRFCTYDPQLNAWMPTDGNQLADMSNEINEVIIGTIFLLDYLKKNGYIFLYQRANSDYNDYSRIPQGDPVSPMVISDQNITRILSDNFHKSIYASQIIIDLVNNEFKTSEDIQHEQNIGVATEGLRVANNSIIVAYVAIVIGVITSIISIVVSWPDNKPLEINKSQFESLKESGQVNEQVIKEILDIQKNEVILLDTINTNIKKLKNGSR